jgi:hypothetical protein
VDLLPVCVVVPRLKPTAGIRPASRLAAGQNLSPRHLLLFMRWLPGSVGIVIEAGLVILGLFQTQRICYQRFVTESSAGR